MKVDTIQTVVNRFKTSQKDFMIRCMQRLNIFTYDTIWRKKNLWIDSNTKRWILAKFHVYEQCTRHQGHNDT